MTQEGFAVTAAPFDLGEGEVLLVCPHEPWEHWYRVAGRDFRVEFADGREVAADVVAVCAGCRDLPLARVELRSARRLREGRA